MTEKVEAKKLNVEGIKALAATMQARKDKKGAGGKFPQATFLPEGNHQGRIITDPMGNLYREVRTHGYFAYGIQAPADCDNLPENFDFGRLDDMIDELYEYNHWKYGLKYNILFYFFLQKTDAASDNWKPNNLYAVIGNGKVAGALTDFITALAEDSPEVLEGMLDKDSKGSPTKITLVRGNQGSVSFTPLFSKTDPVPTDDTYQPLSAAYVRDGYDADKYTGLLKRVQKDLDEVRAQRKARGLPLVGDAGFAEAKAAEEAAEGESGKEGSGDAGTKDAGSAGAEAKSEGKAEASSVEDQGTAEAAAEPENTPDSDEAGEESSAASRFAKFRKQ